VDNQLAYAKDFVADGKTARQNNQAIIVMFSSETCHFCETMAVEILQPMQIVQKDSNYMIRKLNIDEPTKIKDFDGNETTMVRFARKNNIKITPTLAFFDDKGGEPAERIVGLYTLELLGYYVDSSTNLVSRKIAQGKTPNE
jgi:thioredoxin-related protein